MTKETELRQLVGAIHAEPELDSCLIGYYGSDSSRVLHNGVPGSPNYIRVMVIVEETGGLGPRLLDVPPAAPDAPLDQDGIPAAVSNRSRMTAELVGTGLSCTVAAISAAGVVAGAAAEVPTGGASTILVVLAWTGMVTSGAQCINGIVRSVEAYSNPDDNSLQRWDSNRIYSTASLIVDGVGLAAGIASLPVATRNLLAILERRGGMAAASRLQQMSRTERAAETRRALEQATRTPEGRAAVEQALRESGLTARQAEQTLVHGASTARRARTVSAAISQETTRRLNASVRDILGTGLGIANSASPSDYTGSASGVLNAVILHVLERE